MSPAMINESESRAVTVSRSYIPTSHGRYDFNWKHLWSHRSWFKPQRWRTMLWQLVIEELRHSLSVDVPALQVLIVWMHVSMGWKRKCAQSCALIHTVNLLVNETLESERLQQTLGSLLTGSVKMKARARLKLRFDNRPTCQSLSPVFRWLPCITGHYLPPQLVMTVNIKHQRGRWQYGIHESIHRNALPNPQCRISSQSGLKIDWSYITRIIPEIQPNPLDSVCRCQQSCFFCFVLFYGGFFEMWNLGILFQNEISHVCKSINTADRRAGHITQASI